uniref:Uncharacterized protein n=1 Tax=Candidatus Kentrum sp. TUN TaxID=2126343 RepID=A0A450ZLW0_9GAMM|nr:MAG: hypothetical protein BECKTUN1418F_GA0071002_10552 [Candidatus Kentron sp. TUN]VFK59175.1 MAG: hypothetical protein BECKTUN1418E_GA0071001_10522 [Candidatus Kentron sp. TUN]
MDGYARMGPDSEFVQNRREPLRLIEFVTNVAKVLADPQSLKCRLDTYRQPRRPGDGSLLGPDHRQGEEMTVITGQTRQEPCAQKGGLPGPRGTQNDEQPINALLAQAPQFVQGAHQGGIAPEEDSGINDIQGAKAPVRAPLRIGGWRPGKGGGIQARLLQTVFEARQPLGR